MGAIRWRASRPIAPSPPTRPTTTSRPRTIRRSWRQPASPIRGSPIGSRQSGWQSRSEEHTSELQSLMRISYAVFCLKKKKKTKKKEKNTMIQKDKQTNKSAKDALKHKYEDRRHQTNET